MNTLSNRIKPYVEAIRASQSFCVGVLGMSTLEARKSLRFMGNRRLAAARVVTAFKRVPVAKSQAEPSIIGIATLGDGRRVVVNQATGEIYSEVR